MARIKAVDLEQRIISGHAAAHSNLDRVRDVIEPQASVKAIRRLANPASVAVFIGHQHDSLPIGIPIKIEATPEGLYTETLIKPGVFGDDLLQTARFLQEHGQPLGMSIGYQTEASRPDRLNGKMIRRILDYSLKEFSFAANQMIANPKALVTSVKAGDDASYTVMEQAGRFHVKAADGTSLIDFATRVEATAARAALSAAAQEDAGEDMADGPMSMMSAGKTTEDRMEHTVWDTAYVHALPDSAFLGVGPGGQQDDEHKTVPRSLRYLPYRDATGQIDLAQLRSAIAQLGQRTALPGLDERKQVALQARARKLLEDTTAGTSVSEAGEWKTGAPLAVRALGYALLDLSQEIAEEHKAMALLGEETKGNLRIRAAKRDQLAAVAKEIAAIMDWSAMIDRNEDGAAKVAWYRQQLALTEV
jgi:hypothetical protein